MVGKNKFTVVGQTILTHNGEHTLGHLINRFGHTQEQRSTTGTDNNDVIRNDNNRGTI